MKIFHSKVQPAGPRFTVGTRLHPSIPFEIDKILDHLLQSQARKSIYYCASSPHFSITHLNDFDLQENGVEATHRRGNGWGTGTAGDGKLTLTTLSSSQRSTGEESQLDGQDQPNPGIFADYDPSTRGVSYGWQ